MLRHILAPLILLFATTFISAQVSLPFEENFEIADLNPTAWTARPGLSGPDGLVELGDYGTDQSRGVYLGKSADGTDLTVNALDLSLDLADERDVTLDFWIASNFDESQEQDGLYLSDDGGRSFVKAQGFYPSDWCASTYGAHPTIDIDRAANALGLSLTSNFVVRFQQAGLDDQSGRVASREDGLFLDDIRIRAGRLAYATIPFVDDFDASDELGRTWSLRTPVETAAGGTLVDRVATPMSLVAPIAGLGLGDTRALVLTRRCDGPTSASSADLHLDLSGAGRVDLSFTILSNFDEAGAEDGIYLSDDGGASFDKIVDFYGDEWCSGVFGEFPPVDLGAAAARVGRSLTARTVVRFQQAGSSDLSGRVASREDGYFIDDVRVYDPGTMHASIPFAEDFESNRLGDAWRQATPTATQSLPLDNSPTGPMTIAAPIIGEGVDGTIGLFLGRRCDGVFAASAADLHLDLSRARRPLLTFDIRSNLEETQVDDALYFSDDGGVTFAKAVELEPGTWCANTWGTYPPIDIAAAAQAADVALTDRFVMRFQQYGSSDRGGRSASNEDGIAIDNISVTDEDIVYARIPFSDGFENARFEQHWRHRDASATASIFSEEGVTTPMALLEVVEGTGVEGSYAAAFGRRCDGPFAVNALDLHLDLNLGRNIVLGFELLNNFDATDADDGLYLSNDDGATYTKVFDFALSERPNSYEAYVVDVSAAARDAGLALSDRSVIRFQQRGNRDFSGRTAPNEDGFYVDNVTVTGETVSDLAKTPDVKLLALFPNPATDRVTVLGDIGEVAEACILDAVGQEVARVSGGRYNGSFDVSLLPDGSYTLLLVREDGELARARFVKQ